MNIEVSENTYNRLSNHAEGFETPDNVIGRLLDFYEGRKSALKPEIIFHPDEATFKEELIAKKTAWKVIEYADETKEVEKWLATRITADSNLRANLWSGTLRDWQTKGIRKLTLSTTKPDSKILEDVTVNSIIEIQIGKFIQNHLDAIVDYCEKNPSHINELTSLEWSQKHFDLSSFPFMSLPSSIPTGNTVRYWRPEYPIKGAKYRFCSQFGGSTMVGTKTKSEYQGQKFLRYLKSRGLLLPEYKDVDIKFIVKS